MKHIKKSIVLLIALILILVSLPTLASAATVGDQLTAPEPGWQRYDDTDALFHYSEGWVFGGDSTCYNGSYSQADSTTSSVSFLFYGTKLRLISMQYAIYPSPIYIYIDGVESTFSINDTESIDSQIIVFERTDLASGIHHVEIKQTTLNDTRLGYVMDAIDIEGYLIDPDNPPVVEAPLDLYAVAGNSQVNLTWDSVDGATTYTLKRSLTNGGPYITIAIGLTGTTYTDLDVINGTTYYYIVTAVNEAGESAPSNEAFATPFAPAPEPTAGRALIVITMVSGLEKEYDWSSAEVNDFLDWYDARDVGVGPARYEVVKTYNIGPFLSRKDYLMFDKIMMFEIMAYEEE